MNESLQNAQPQAEAPALSEADRQALHQKIAANRGTIAAQTDSDIYELGTIGSRPVVNAFGEVTTQRDREEELRLRRENGHAYQR